MNQVHKKICDALETFDLPALREMDEYLHTLMEKLETCESPHTPNREVVKTKQRPWGVLRLEKVQCGRERCKCVRGKLHGPYWYLYEKHKDYSVSQDIGSNQTNGRRLKLLKTVSLFFR
jgi:hypothetical protein